ncbi:membrane protein [Caballeronia glathei]|uniref:Membrane protein n=1 Tax=Caballeronia glathei TaxID=60547 RepID=A0A069PJC6_9BURK|nr:membrane protein [Caballeronia glathei]
MNLFRPGLDRTFLPGALVLPAADRDMFLTCRSSIHTIVWFWLIVVVALCR